MKNDQDRFEGYGTVLVSDIVCFSNLGGNWDPLQLMELVHRHRYFVCAMIEAHGGVIYHSAGDAVLAYWHPRNTAPNHAQMAYEAAREIVQAMPAFQARQGRLGYDLDIALGTGKMAGDTSGSSPQFQIKGDAMSIAGCISRSRTARGTQIRMSQTTLALLDNPDEIADGGLAGRRNAGDMLIFTYAPDMEASRQRELVE